MSETRTRQLIERYLDAFNRSDHEAMLACLSEDVARDKSGGGREIGKEKFRWFLGLSARHFREELSDVAIMTAPGGVRAAAEFTLHGTYRSTLEGLPEARGQRYSLPAGMFFEVDDGLISRLTFHLDRAAREAQIESA
ncbi:ketosteroid isomerase-related protein [Chelativorans sp. M5D2P16]|uniref:ketosteroid isomerase-related protein n=1 Tax=Chelativorans sp. M5D2P16 TaxID=3095678 RepID=UPI002ACAC980|nr:ketosteroid isomerase-related protein [Chelativorans sp. M5D2P16]MDZ5698121.1 ketosteroid isomerase-related protein [Chelativorans sp. M5D2P16]